VAKKVLTKFIAQQIAKAVQKYTDHRTDFFNLARRVENDLVENQKLKRFIHSTKFREKDPEHLQDKLKRKATEARISGKRFTISAANLFEKLDDLAGVRILHIHREQLRDIDPLIRETFTFHGYTLREKPKAFTWDSENASFFTELGFDVETKATFYTSVHYVVQPHWAKFGCELQVRTLAEELWGEVSHQIEYPHPSGSKSCVEQIKVLARVASGCTRLVDSIFATRDEYLELKHL
jgi:putative GTP pyrophosphokinase